MRRSLVLLPCLALLACPRPSTGLNDGVRERVEPKADAKAEAALVAARGAATAKSRRDGVEALLAVRKAYPESIAGQDALYEAGVLAFEEGDYVTARKALNELVFDNPLYPKANDARLKSGLSALELKAYRDAYQTLSSLVERLEGKDKETAERALAKAAAYAQSASDALKAALKACEDDADPKAALERLTELVDTQATFLALSEAWQGLSHAHPGWPLLTFKMARIFYHLRDWTRLDESLKALIAEAPQSPYAPEARELQARVSKRLVVQGKRIGAVLPLSGKFKNLGEAVLKGLTLALKGSDLELVAKDSKGDVNLAGQLVEELTLQDGVIAIVGPLLADDSRRAALVAEELGVPILTLTRTEGITAVGTHVFRNMVTNRQQAQALVAYATQTLGYKSFAVLYPNMPFGVELTNEFWDEVDRQGGTIRGAELYTHDQTTYTDDVKKLVGRYFLEDRADYLEKLREVREAGLDPFRKRKALEKLKGGLDPIIDFEALLIPDSWERVSLVAPALAVEDIITNACDKRDIEKIQKTTGKTKLKTVTLLGPSTWSSPRGQGGLPQLVERGGKFVYCSVYVDGFYDGSKRPRTVEFVEAFHEAYAGAQPMLLNAIGFDSGGLLRQVLEKSAPRTREDLTARLQVLKDYEGATGTIRFDDNREAQRPLFLLGIDAKGIKELPAPGAVDKPAG